MSTSHNKEIAKQYDIISVEFDDTRIRIWNTVKNFLMNKENDKERLLDAGVGNGKNIIFANENGYDCIGFDISNNLLDICNNKGLNVYQEDILNITPRTYGLFDKIICIAVIHHLESLDIQKRALINLIKCLYTGGKLLVSVWSLEVYDNSDKKDYRKFTLGKNIVKWKAKNKSYEIDRFYYIHNYETFFNMINNISNIIPIDYNISWEKQNWFCEITKI